MKQLAEAISDAYNHALEFDCQAALAKQRYVNWVLALAAFGFIVVFSKKDEVLAFSWVSPQIGRTFLDVAAGVFLGSGLLGGLTHTGINCYLDLTREQMTLLLRQLLRIKDSDASEIQQVTTQELARNISSGAFLSSPDRMRYDEIKEMTAKTELRYKRLSAIQQVLIGIGYATMFIALIG